DVGGQQAGFQLVQQVVVDGLLAEEQAGHAFADAGTGLGQALLEAGKEAQLGRLLLCHGNRCRFDRDFRERRSFRHIHGFVDLCDRLRLGFRLRLRCDFRLNLHFGDGLGLLGLDLGQLLSGLLVGFVGERLAVFQRLGWWRLGGRGLRLLAQPAEQAFLLAGLGRRLLIVVGTKHGEDFLKRAKRRRPCHRPDGGYPSTVQPTALNTTVGPNLFGQGCRGRINSALRSSWSRGCLTLGDYAPVIYRCRSIHAPLCPDHDAPVPCPRVFPPASTIRRDSFLNESFTMPPMLRRAAALLFAALYLPLVTAADIQPTHEFFLDNGLKVIVREDHRAPAVVSQLWYKVGSSYETPGQTGLSHALEHMMFKGSRKLGAGEASRILRELGAEENAFTSDDYTAYYQVLARDRLAVAFELEADRLASLKLPADEFAREIEVIKEERRLRTDDKPTSLAYERFKAMAYPASGYHTPTIGWMDHPARITIEELRAWYQAWDTPNTPTLEVATGGTAEAARSLDEHYFGPIEKRAVPSAKRPLELDEPGERRLTLHLNTQVPSLMMAFNTASLATETDNPRQIHALRLIAALLDGGYSARLPQQ